MKTVYFNMNLNDGNGVETIDELSRADFNSDKEFRLEVRRICAEYNLAGMPTYTSSRCTKEWKQK